MRRTRAVRGRRGFTVRDLAVGVTCLLVAGSLLVSLTGATRDLSQTQMCAHNLRQMFTGLTAYVNQYNCYPPNNPYPQYTSNPASGFDPNIGWIMTYGLGLTPPATDSATGHFKWYGTTYADLPDVCKCPGMSPALLDPANPEVDSASLETNLYQYALSYMTSGTCRSATTLIQERTTAMPGIGGRNPTIPDPTSGTRSAQQYDNAYGGVPYVWVQRHNSAAPDDPAAVLGEYPCWVQAIAPSELDQPGRVFYMADSRDYRPIPGGWPSAGKNSGWTAGYGNQIFTSARHYGYGNTLYLDGAVSRDGQAHQPQWYNTATNQWRVATFNANVRLANINGQMPIMPVFQVKGWEAFFDANGLKAK